MKRALTASVTTVMLCLAATVAIRIDLVTRGVRKRSRCVKAPSTVVKATKRRR